MDKMQKLPISTQDFKESDIIEVIALIHNSWCKQLKDTTHTIDNAIKDLIDKWSKDFDKDGKLNAEALSCLKKIYETNIIERDELNMFENNNSIRVKTEENLRRVPIECKRKHTISTSESNDMLNLPNTTLENDGVRLNKKERRNEEESIKTEDLENDSGENKNDIEKRENDNPNSKSSHGFERDKLKNDKHLDQIKICRDQNIETLNMDSTIPVLISNRHDIDYAKKTTHSLEVKYETDENVISRREKQIQYGKNTAAYKRYINQIQKNERSSDMPVTPNKNLSYSRRHFDSMIKHWKLTIHNWDRSANGAVADDKDAEIKLKTTAPQKK